MNDFHGVKVALVHEGKILVYLRDNRPEINFPGLWDLPGGGRELNESARETAIREISEEFGILIEQDQLIYEKDYPSMHDGTVTAKFFVGYMTPRQVASISFGSEGQEYKLVSFEEYLSIENAVKPLQDRFRAFLELGISVKL